MTHNEAAMKLSSHLMSCGMLMPAEWLEKNGEGSDLFQAFRMAMDTLREREPLLEDLKRTFLDDPCIACLHGQPPAPCDGSDFTCEVCTKPCACKTCADFDHWVWRGPREISP